MGPVEDIRCLKVLVHDAAREVTHRCRLIEAPIRVALGGHLRHP